MARNFLYGLVLGAAAGAAAGFVFAPKPGCRTREDLSAKGRVTAVRLKRTASRLVGKHSDVEEPVKQSI